jgi:ubiquitin carboxyl-terminal hydrolase 25/28
VITPATREFINDVMIELDVLISNRPPEEQWTSKVSVLHVPVPALKDIERSLGYHDYPKRSRTVDLSKQEHPHYASLGVVDDFTDNFLLWAYERQCECDSSNRPYYLDCLRDIAHGRKSSELEMKVAMAASEGEVGLQEVEEAFRFFALDPDTREGDEYIIGVYNSRIESAPRQKDDARKCLRVIAKARNSQKIEAVANDRAMSFEEALAFLNVTEDTQSDSIEAAAVAMVIIPLYFAFKLHHRPILSWVICS